MIVHDQHPQGAVVGTRVGGGLIRRVEPSVRGRSLRVVGPGAHPAVCPHDSRRPGFEGRCEDVGRKVCLVVDRCGAAPRRPWGKAEDNVTARIVAERPMGCRVAIAPGHDQGKGEGGPFAGSAAGRQTAAHQFDQIPADREAKAGATVSGADALHRLVERTEKTLQLRGGHSWTCIGDLDQDGVIRRLLGPGRKLQGNGPRRGELHGVGQQVVEHLPQPHRIALDRGRERRCALDPQGQALGPGLALPEHQGLGDEAPQIEVHAIDRHVAGFQLGVVKKVVQQGLHHDAGIGDQGGLGASGAVSRAALQLGRPGHDGAYGGAQVVADRGEKDLATGHDAFGLGALAVGLEAGGALGLGGLVHPVPG